MDDVRMEDLPPITRLMMERSRTHDMEFLEKGETSFAEGLLDQLLSQGDMFVFAIARLELKLNQLIKLSGYDIELTHKT
jgi:hypothetical protein